MSPELEQTLSMLSSHRSVLGYMLVTRGHHPSIIRHSGVVFEGEQGKRYAAVVARIVESVQAGLEEVRVDDGLTAAATGETDVVRGLSDPCLFHETLIFVFARMRFDS
jgi:dynein light chain roadblock-type